MKDGEWSGDTETVTLSEDNLELISELGHNCFYVKASVKMNKRLCLSSDVIRTPNLGANS